uniref:Phosphoribosyl-AMP cyclohydrolase domain-containing protein n=1 Tax=Fibrocapsa japonica TaxID=94617 RepID=A0A7S2V4U4_9STRA|mmetsp:Transcript_4434/g.6634  ORF Transcript_4434/g.6634 Transcript_4434/m.6634 type:complete len:439 (+) Transcript_4434:17-1333(+)
MIIPSHIVTGQDTLDEELIKSLALLGDVQLTYEDFPPSSVSCVSLLRATKCLVGPFDWKSTESLDSATSWLDKGAAAGIFDILPSSETLSDIRDALSTLPRDRVIVRIVISDVAGEGSEDKLASLKDVVGEVGKVASRVILACTQEEAESFGEVCEAMKEVRGKEGSPDHVGLVLQAPLWTPDQVGAIHRMKPQVDAACPAAILPEDAPPQPGKVSLADAFMACCRTDRPDGLFTTVVVDECGVALGLVYSNALSVKASFAAKRGVYWSRSRGGLWRKGDTSGAVQELKGISIDCDSDALCFRVDQKGDPPAFCHLNRRTCWDAGRGIGKLERTLTQRLANAPAGSYTKRLFDDPALLRNKLLEEVQELVEAETVGDVAAEAADVMYFMMVRCVAAGVKLADIERDLDAKSLKVKRRPGNAKRHRIEAAEKVVGPATT